MINTLKLIPVFAAAVLALPTVSTQARGESELTRMAHNIERISREIKNEFQTHYTRSSAYRHLLSDVNSLLSKADHIDKLTHNPYTSYQHMKADLVELDKLAHHLHTIIDGIEKGRYSGWVEDGLGHVHGKVRSLNSAIHSMKRAVEAYSRPPVSNDCNYSNSSSHDYRTTAPAPVYRTESPRAQSDWDRLMRSMFGGRYNSASSNRGGYNSH